jgi:hypothetical protein
MIVTNVISLKCDKCGKEDIFRCQQIASGECLIVGDSELRAEGWSKTYSERGAVKHCCKECKGK